MGEDAAKRIYDKIDEVNKNLWQQGERLARIEENVKLNSKQCTERSEWMKGVDQRMDKLDEKAASIGGAKGVVALLISIFAAIGAWMSR